MGYVFAAVDSRLRRDVAIKLMRETIASSPDSTRKFINEARSMAAVSHDNVATVFEVGTHRGMPLIAMERLAGDPLDRRLIRNDSFSIDEVLRIASEIADGLAAAAQRGIVHRDIKPANIWIQQPGGRVKILDFGLAVVNRDSIADDQTGSATRSSHLVGSPGYLSPEQVRGDIVDGRTDLYSLGVVMYRLIGGELPLKSETLNGQLIAIVCHQPMALVLLKQGTPKLVSDLVDRLLSKEPRHRFASAAELAAVVKEIRSKIDSDSHPAISIDIASAGGTTTNRFDRAAEHRSGHLAKNKSRNERSGRKLNRAKRRGKNTAVSPDVPASPDGSSNQTDSANQDSSVSGGTAARQKPAAGGFSTSSRTIVIAVGLAIVAVAGIAWFRPTQRLASTTTAIDQPLSKPLAASTPEPVPITVAQISTLKIGSATANDSSVLMGDAVVFSVEINSVADPTDNPNADPRRLRRGNVSIAQIRTRISSDEMQPREMGFSRKLAARSLPAPGKTTPVTVQFFTADLPIGIYQCEFELQTPDGITADRTTASIEIVDSQTEP